MYVYKSCHLSITACSLLSHISKACDRLLLDYWSIENIPLWNMILGIDVILRIIFNSKWIFYLNKWEYKKYIFLILFYLWRMVPWILDSSSPIKTHSQNQEMFQVVSRTEIITEPNEFSRTWYTIFLFWELICRPKYLVMGRFFLATKVIQLSLRYTPCQKY